jgi:opacity protein-like surface antigen
MRMFISVAATIVLFAMPAFAQTERGYVEGSGGFAITPDTTSGAVLGEVGVRVAPHLFAFGDLGQFRNVQPSQLQPSVDGTTALLSSTEGLNVVGVARVPAWYSMGGLRFEPPPAGRVSPYIFGGAGFARLSPTATFTYTNGPLGDSTAAPGDDVTDQIISLGDFTQPAPTTAFMFGLGGGVRIPVAAHLAVDAGYRFSRIASDTPMNVQGATFGIGYRF